MLAGATIVSLFLLSKRSPASERERGSCSTMIKLVYYCSSRRGEYGLARSVVPGSARGGDVYPAEASASL